MTGRDLKKLPALKGGEFNVPRGYAGNAGSNSIHEAVKDIDHAMNRTKRR
jgi:hypothetical protein